MHSEVPFAARGRSIFCQEASPGRLGFVFLALPIFKLFVICISWLCSLRYVYMEQSRATDSPFFKLVCLTHWWLSLQRFCTFPPVCFSLLVITAILQGALNLHIVTITLERQTLACCPPKHSLPIILQNLISHIAVHWPVFLFSTNNGLSLSHFLWETLSVDYQRYSTRTIWKPTLLYYIWLISVIGLHHKHIYSVKIMIGKMQESTALWKVPNEVSVVVTGWGFFFSKTPDTANASNTDSNY